MEIYQEMGWKTIQTNLKLNYLKIPVNNVPISESGAEIFNKLYLQLKGKEWKRIVRTPSGGISISVKNFRPPMWDVQVTNSYVEITIVERVSYRLHFSNFKKGDNSITGRRSFQVFKQVCKKYNINIDSLAIENGEEVKKEIEKAKIELIGESNWTYSNVHHIDLNSSHISGMVESFPILRPAFEEIYSKRKENEIYKNILTHTWGYMQSKYIKYKWAHISKAGIAYTNRRLQEISEKLRESGRRIIAYNTDGIWYQGEIYHDDTEGKELGMWKNDHINCTFRAKSKGAYEFIEDGKYTPIVRGRTKLDKAKPREEWEWGDIFKEDCQVLKFYFDPDLGIVIEED